eukprot:1523180-Amphidinium_carterae.1
MRSPHEYLKPLPISPPMPGLVESALKRLVTILARIIDAHKRDTAYRRQLYPDEGEDGDGVDDHPLDDHFAPDVAMSSEHRSLAGEGDGSMSAQMSPPDAFQIPVAPPCCYKATRPLHFAVHVPKYKGSHSWPYGSVAWNRLLRFLTIVKVARSYVSSVPRATVLELCMSYVLFSGARFNTGLGDNMHGSWLSVQLDRFTKAIQSLQHLCALESLVATKLDAHG